MPMPNGFTRCLHCGFCPVFVVVVVVAICGCTIAIIYSIICVYAYQINRSSLSSLWSSQFSHSFSLHISFSLSNFRCLFLFFIIIFFSVNVLCLLVCSTRNCIISDCCCDAFERTQYIYISYNFYGS